MPSPSGWRRMLTLFTLASFIEVIAYGQLAAFTPLHLPTIGVAPDDVPIAVGLITVGANVIGLLFLPFWGVLADRYGRKPLIIRSFVATGSGLAIAAFARNVWMFTFARGLTALNLGNSGLMMTTLQESAPAARLGFAFGVVNGAGPLGAFIGPLVGGPLVDRYGFNVVLAIDAILLALVVAGLTIRYRDAFVPLVASPAIGALADRFGHWRTLYIAAVIDGVLWLLPWVARDYWPFVIAFAIVSGLGSGVFSLSFNVLASSTTDATRARVMTFAYLPLNLAFIVGPGIGTFIVSRDPFLIFPAAVVFTLAGVPLLAAAARCPLG